MQPTQAPGAGAPLRNSARDHNFDFGGREQNNRTLRQGAAAEIERLDWTKGDPTVVRIYPHWNPANPLEFDPWRMSPERRDYSDWLYTVNLAKIGTGPGTRTWICHHPLDRSADMANHPVQKLYSAVNQAIDARQEGQGWPSLVKGKVGTAAPLAAPRNCALLQVAVMESRRKIHNPPRGFHPSDVTKIVVLTPRLVVDLSREVDLRVEGFKGDPLDPAGYVHGDPVGLAAGKFLCLYKLGSDPRQAPVVQTAVSWNAAPAAQAGAREEKPDIGYGCFLMDQFNGASPDLRQYEPWVRQKVQRWDSLLEYPSLDEQLMWTVQTFTAFPDLIVYALDEIYGSKIEQFFPGLREAGLKKLGRSQPVVSGFAPATAQVAYPYGPPPAPGAQQPPGQPPHWTPTWEQPPQQPGRSLTPGEMPSPNQWPQVPPPAAPATPQLLPQNWSMPAAAAPSAPAGHYGPPPAPAAPAAHYGPPPSAGAFGPPPAPAGAPQTHYAPPPAAAPPATNPYGPPPAAAPAAYGPPPAPPNGAVPLNPSDQAVQQARLQELLRLAGASAPK